MSAAVPEDAAAEAAFLNELRAGIGTTGEASVARDPVNAPMIRHWCDAMTDHNPVYTDPAAAEKSVHGGLVAPPTMLQAWSMLGLIPRPSGASADPQGRALSALDAAGYSSVVATNCEHEYLRYLAPGELLSGRVTLTDVSAEKKTGLGIGHFVTSTTSYTNQDGEEVGRMLFRLLKFKPGTGRSAPPADPDAPPRMQKPRPGIIQETRFFWEGLRAGELRIQRCPSCGVLHHPPRVRCNICGSYEFDSVVASGRGHVYSFVEPVHPKVPAFDYPLIVGLVELEEGTRLLTNIVDCDPEKVRVGMPVELDVREANHEMPLPLFRPARPPRNEETLRFDEVAEGQELESCPIPLTRTLIIATAIASRDYQDVHHDPVLAKKRGSPDIFMNILTTGGLCGRYVGDWAGPNALFKKLAIRLGAPNYPDDCMIMDGRVEQKRREGGEGLVDVAVRGHNRLGDHVTGTITLALPI